jgi:hypothetical protein
MVDGTGGSIGTEQRVVFQSLGPHNPTLTSNPAVPPHRLGKPSRLTMPSFLSMGHKLTNTDGEPAIYKEDVNQ